MGRVTNQGGKRAGAGKPSGGALVAVPVPERSRTYVTSDSDPMLLTAIRLRACGASYKRIGATLGHDWRTVQGWCTSHEDLVRQEVDRLTPEDLMAPLVPAAVAIQRRILEPDEGDPQPSLELQAMMSEKVLDRSKGKSITRQLTASVQQMNITIVASGLQATEH